MHFLAAGRHGDAFCPGFPLQYPGLRICGGSVSDVSSKAGFSFAQQANTSGGATSGASQSPDWDEAHPAKLWTKPGASQEILPQSHDNTHCPRAKHVYEMTQAAEELQVCELLNLQP